MRIAFDNSPAANRRFGNMARRRIYAQLIFGPLLKSRHNTAGNIIPKSVNDGSRYNDKSIILLNKLKPADKLLITEITIRDIRNKVYQVKPIELSVK
jgi:hypothetical protein